MTHYLNLVAEAFKNKHFSTSSMRQKRGMMSLEEVVKLIPVILLVFLAIALFSRQLGDLGDQSTTLEAKDIAALARDFALVQPDGSLSIPSRTLAAGRTEQCSLPDQENCYRPITITLYPALESPGLCKGKACVCGYTANTNELLACYELAAVPCSEKLSKQCSAQACVREKKTLRLNIAPDLNNKIVLSRQCRGDLGLDIVPVQGIA